MPRMPASRNSTCLFLYFSVVAVNHIIRRTALTLSCTAHIRACSLSASLSLLVHFLEQFLRRVHQIFSAGFQRIQIRTGNICLIRRTLYYCLQ